jgi:hypothetical protein
MNFDLDLNEPPIKRCENCFTDYTSQWRSGYCNACSTFYHKNGYFKDTVEIYAKVLLDIYKNKKFKQFKNFKNKK